MVQLSYLFSQHYPTPSEIVIYAAQVQPSIMAIKSISRGVVSTLNSGNSYNKRIHEKKKQANEQWPMQASHSQLSLSSSASTSNASKHVQPKGNSGKAYNNKIKMNKKQVDHDWQQQREPVPSPSSSQKSKVSSKHTQGRCKDGKSYNTRIQLNKDQEWRNREKGAQESRDDGHADSEDFGFMC